MCKNMSRFVPFYAVLCRFLANIPTKNNTKKAAIFIDNRLIFNLQRLRESNPCCMRERHVSQPLDEDALERKLGDSNPRYGNPHVSLANWWFQPLTQTSLLPRISLPFSRCFPQLRCKGSFFSLNLQAFGALFSNKTHKSFFFPLCLMNQISKINQINCHHDSTFPTLNRPFGVRETPENQDT